MISRLFYIRSESPKQQENRQLILKYKLFSNPRSTLFKMPCIGFCP